MTKEEKETIITYNEAEEFAVVYTCTLSMMNKLDKYGFERMKEYKNDGVVVAVEYKVPDKKLISIRGKRRTGKPLTEEHKQKLLEARMKA